MFLFSFPLAIAGFAGIINETLDRILLKQILYNPNVPSSLDYAEAQVGIYSASYKLAMLVTILLQAYRYAAEPFFFSQMKNLDRNKVYSQIMNVFIAFVCGVFLLVTLNLEVFKHFIQNESYWVGLQVVPILLMANIFLSGVSEVNICSLNFSQWPDFSHKLLSNNSGVLISLYPACFCLILI